MKSHLVYLIPLLLAGCSAHKAEQAVGTEVSPEITDNTVAPDTTPVSAPVPEQAHLQPMVMGGSQADMPSAVLYRMNGDYSDNVPVNINTRGRLLSYPAPSDLTEDSRPIEIQPGLWLDRRGIGPDTRFTSWTYAEYMALPETPTPGEIGRAIIPEARVTETYVLPFSAAEAAADTAAVVNYLKENPL